MPRWLPRRLPRRSLLARILVVHALGIAAAAFVTLGVADAVLQVRARIIEHHVLREQAAGILNGLSLDTAQAVRIDYARTPLSEAGSGLFVFAVLDAQGQVRLRGNDPLSRRFAHLRRLQHVRFLTLRRHPPVLATIIEPIALSGQPFWLAVGWNLSAPGVIFDNILSGYLWYAALITLLMLLLLLGIDLVVVRGAMRPMLRVIEAVRLSNRSGDAWRLSLDELPNEIMPLAGAYNDALDRTEAAYRLQREFVGDAAHELRTPLAVLRARLETLPDHASRRMLLSDVGVMTRIVAQLLEIASLERLLIDADAIADPSAVCASVVEALAPMAIAARCELGLTVAAPPPSLRIRDQELFQVVRNLVENAINHTGDNTCIDVRVEADGLVVVQDDGPGIPPELHQAVFERFWRRDRRDRSGAGLGLAIVQRIVATHGGTITLASTEGAGCRFSIRLPHAPQAN